VPEWLQNALTQWKLLSGARKATLAATALGSLAFFAWLATGATRAEYKVLYRGLEEAEAAEVVEALSAERIDYRLGEGGSAVLVPGPLVHEARIRVAGQGLPSGTAPGFELFDEGSFGVTDFVQKVNYRRALQGELARSVEQLEPVERARVQIALPERSVFLREDDRRPSASVVLRLRPSRDVTSDQARGIVHLVASSVEGLDPARVTVVDDHGRILSPDGGGAPGPRAPTGALEAQHDLERKLEERIESILERTVGIGGVVARVSAELDWTQTETTEERYDPDSQVARSEQTTTEQSEDTRREPAGRAGVVANSPDLAAATGEPGGSTATSTRTSETVNYEISKTVSHEVAPTGTLSRLSVAVLVDGPSAGPGAGGADGEGDGEAPTWTEEQLRQFEEIARRAVGFDAERGDEISVLHAPFRTLPMEEEPGTLLDPRSLWLLTSVLRWVGVLVALLVFARVLVKPLVQTLKPDPETLLGLRAGALSAQLAGGEGAGGEEGADALEAPPRPQTLQERVNQLTEKRSEDSVKTIRGWLGS